MSTMRPRPVPIQPRLCVVEVVEYAPRWCRGARRATPCDRRALAVAVAAAVLAVALAWWWTDVSGRDKFSGGLRQNPDKTFDRLNFWAKLPPTYHSNPSTVLPTNIVRFCAIECSQVANVCEVHSSVQGQASAQSCKSRRSSRTRARCSSGSFCASSSRRRRLQLLPLYPRLEASEETGRGANCTIFRRRTQSSKP